MPALRHPPSSPSLPDRSSLPRTRTRTWTSSSCQLPIFSFPPARAHSGCPVLVPVPVPVLVIVVYTSYRIPWLQAEYQVPSAKCQVPASAVRVPGVAVVWHVRVHLWDEPPRFDPGTSGPLEELAAAGGRAYHKYFKASRAQKFALSRYLLVSRCAPGPRPLHRRVRACCLRTLRTSSISRRLAVSAGPPSTSRTSTRSCDWPGVRLELDSRTRARARRAGTWQCQKDLLGVAVKHAQVMTGSHPRAGRAKIGIASRDARGFWTHRPSPIAHRPSPSGPPAREEAPPLAGACLLAPPDIHVLSPLILMESQLAKDPGLGHFCRGRWSAMSLKLEIRLVRCQSGPEVLAWKPRAGIMMVMSSRRGARRRDWQAAQKLAAAHLGLASLLADPRPQNPSRRRKEQKSNVGRSTVHQRDPPESRSRSRAGSRRLRTSGSSGGVARRGVPTSKGARMLMRERIQEGLRGCSGTDAPTQGVNTGPALPPVARASGGQRGRRYTRNCGSSRPQSVVHKRFVKTQTAYDEGDKAWDSDIPEPRSPLRALAFTPCAGRYVCVSRANRGVGVRPPASYARSRQRSPGSCVSAVGTQMSRKSEWLLRLGLWIGRGMWRVCARSSGRSGAFGSRYCRRRRIDVGDLGRTLLQNRREGVMVVLMVDPH
ncbi:hypothetical protein L227DRAFT_565021 [Lentinus tigrinus ALCF2SS1-6]|uniref:Uncharacterized protein n=1 Tax=Lentinus tigrinus ALCF2SS1-6 TaxID=1328759 RepID=A0A5C2S9X7_9APHY|nr:hypothetical protein L227DRAFT_565021 [Lentinus tigrinus ALCF2SS1-6]